MAKTAKPMEPIAFKKVIGLPYQGTHATQFNVQGGSNNWQSENAVDLAAPVGTPVYAVEAGTVSPPGYGFGASAAGGRFAGKRLHLVTGDNAFYYAHMSALVVQPGQKVQAGQLLGYSGAANGVAHLHFASERGDPAVLIGAASPETTAAAARSKPAPAPQAAPTQAAPAAAGPTTPPESPQQTEFSGLPAGTGVAAETPPAFTQEAAYWASIAGQPYASPEAQLYAQNAQLMTGS